MFQSPPASYSSKHCARGLARLATAEMVSEASGSRPQDDDPNYLDSAIAARRSASTLNYGLDAGGIGGQCRWRRRNSKVPLPLIVCGPSKNSISARSGIFMRVA